jgi:hypothetical protein
MAHIRQGIAYYLSNSVKSILQPCFAYLLRVVDYASVPIDVTYSMASPLDGQQSVLFLTGRESLILDTQACLREIFSFKIIHVVSPFKMSQIPSVYFSYIGLSSSTYHRWPASSRFLFSKSVISFHRVRMSL